MGIPERISATAASNRDRPAIFARGVLYSYAELVAAARGIRRELQSAGCEKGSAVAVVTGDDLATYASLLAIWSTGAAYVPLNVHNPPERNGQVLRESRAKILLTSRPPGEWSRHLPERLDKVFVINTLESSPDDGELPVPDSAARDLAYIFFTSGSTGKPKGVPITHGNLEAFVDVVTDRLGYDFTPGDRFLQMFEMTFDLSVMSTFVPWCTGGATYVVPEKGISYLNVLDLLAKQEISVALMVPSILPYLQRFFDEICLPDLRLSLFCGEALLHDLVKEWAACIPNGRIENVYGPTEATIFCTTYPWSNDASASEQVNGIVPIGKPVPGTTVAVVDNDGNLCQDGKKGELCLLGDQVMSGYWCDSEKTSGAFIEIDLAGKRRHAYRTGDIAYVNDRGNLVYCGRSDSQVKIDGHRVELGEIEHYARQFIGDSNAAVIVRQDAAGKPNLDLFVATGNLDKEKLESHLRTCLPAYMIPRRVVVLNKLPLNLNGKIDRVALGKLES